MKRIPIIVLLLVCFTLTSFRDGPEDRLTKRGFIDISVVSNVNRILFSYPFNEIDIDYRKVPGEKELDIASIIVPVRDFRCTNKTALNDFLVLLKADRYPYLSITIPDDLNIPDDKTKPVIFKNVIITIAGISKKYDITGQVENEDGDNNQVLVGTLKIRLTSLGLEPPEKFFGLIKVKDEVIVKFGISLEEYRLTANNYLN